MKIIYLSFLLLVVSCNNPDNEINSNSTKYNTKLQKDSITSPIIDKDKKEKLNSVDSFLLNPFDLQNFKHKVGQSNSGEVLKKT